jgi:hypothetical protein
MKFMLYILLFSIITSSAGWSQPVSYKVGEKVSYSVQYGALNGGIASLEIFNDSLNGKEVWHSKIITKTTGIADVIFKILDVYESYIDPASELPLFSIRNIREGRYRRYNEVIFDHKTRSDSAILTSDLTGIHIAPKGIHDVVSCFYYFRNQILSKNPDLVVGDIITINTWFTDELHPIILKYKGIEEIKTKFGKLKCYTFNPVTEVGRLFETEEDATIWFSADKNFLPVRIRFDIFVGSFWVEIIKYEGVLYPLEFKKKS